MADDVTEPEAETPTDVAETTEGTDAAEATEAAAPAAESTGSAKAGGSAKKDSSAKKAEPEVVRKKVASKRVTPKGGAPSGGASRSGSPAKRAAEQEGFASKRYTAPADHKYDMPSPWWVPAIMWTLLAVGFLVIALNYMGVFGDPANIRLVIGLVCILGGIITATQYR